jgi:hypothetical protein
MFDMMTDLAGKKSHCHPKTFQGPEQQSINLENDKATLVRLSAVRG